MSKDLIKRLDRACMASPIEEGETMILVEPGLLEEAAHELERLTSRPGEDAVERARAALKPFADAADECEGAPDDMSIGDASYEEITVAHCRAARDVLTALSSTLSGGR